MPLYRKKPIVVQAVLWTGNPGDQGLQDLAQTSRMKAGAGAAFAMRDGDLWVRTVDGNNVLVPVGAYVVLDGKGWPYPCDAELFEAGHDEITERVEVFPTSNGQWAWHRQAANGEIVADGETYTRRADAVRGAIGANPDFTAETLTIVE